MEILGIIIDIALIAVTYFAVARTESLARRLRRLMLENSAPLKPSPKGQRDGGVEQRGTPDEVSHTPTVSRDLTPIEPPDLEKLVAAIWTYSGKTRGEGERR